MLDSNFDSSKIKILIVDDILANIEVLHATLEPEGYVISVATHGKMALEVAPHLKPDLILLDIMMPGMNGYETCKKLKANENTRDFPVIFISAKGETEDIVEGFRVGGVDYIAKPFRGEEVLSRVKTHAQLHYLKKQQKKQIQELEIKNNKLEKLDAIKNRILGTAMHDLRNPLSSISGFSELFLRGEESYTTDEKKSLVKLINQTSKDLLGLVHDLLDISVFENGELNLNLSSGNLNPILLKQVQMNQVNSSQKKINIVSLLEKVPDSIFDSNRIGQVMDNLISNALKFSQPGTSIEIGLSSSEQNLEFYIKDEGPGIPEKDQCRLFTEFPKIGVYPTGGEKSTGLGLSIVKKIVEAHSGSIEVESIEGQGTIFLVQLPLILARPDLKSFSMFEQHLSLK
jgi:signal transduction histidine kinase